jgi:hypothetical protein
MLSININILNANSGYFLDIIFSIKKEKTIAMHTQAIQAKNNHKIFDSFPGTMPTINIMIGTYKKEA